MRRFERCLAAATPKVKPLHLLLYSYCDDAVERRQPFREAHLQAAEAAASRGDLLLGGALAQPVDGALLAFANASAARSFAEEDPYVKGGVVTNWTVREWSIVVGYLAEEIP
ncbi:hypothetical protein AB1Y20_014111 [Prymnesium parvum]|uniref:YCII-related domain-containing protein n=1 Tax=Prymnesium parvum TaxID=97485 RepID=A0AB34IIT9_PRYPA